MADFVPISKSLPKSAVKLSRWQFYLLLGLFTNAAIWGSVFLYLKVKKPTYSSTWAVSLPGSGSDASVSLPNIGQASYQNTSPYSISSQDPRENYQFIAQSEAVLKTAAEQLKMPPEKFGSPKIKIINNTTMVQFEVKGSSPEEARQKSFALYKALQARLNELRDQELVQRDKGFKSALSSAQEKLEVTQRKLSEYKSRTGLSSNEQVTQLSSNIEQLRRQRAEIIAQQKQVSARLEQLSASLSLSAKQATDAFVLQNDQIFQQNLKDYSEASAALVVLRSKFLPEHPAIIAQKAKQEAAKSALINRSQSLAGRPLSPETLQQLNLSNTNSGSAREKLFQDLVAVKAEQKGLQAQAQEMTQQIAQLEDRLKLTTQHESTLDALKRDSQVAEAVFSSTVARLDIGKSNGLGSYPLIQMITEPSLASEPTSPKKKLALLGAALASFFSTSGLVTLWLRQRKR
jgi:uncharacterized protein involved in exopolysaccharide biosynthesis